MCKDVAWILLRGLGREQAHWNGFAERLSVALDCEVFCPDQLGVGRYWGRAASSKLDDCVEHLRTQLPPSARRYHILGLSMGGALALRWARLHPAQIAGVVCINSSSALSPLHQRFAPLAAIDLLKNIWTGDVEAREYAALNLVSNLQGEDKVIRRRWQRIQEQRPVHRRVLLRQLTLTRTFIPSLLSCPGLVLCSKADRVVSHYCSEDIADEMQWPLHCHQTAGHDLCLDDPAWVIRGCRRWVGTLPKSEFFRSVEALPLQRPVSAL